MEESESVKSNFLSNWSSYFRLAERKNSFILSVLFLLIVLIILPNFLQFIEDRNGVSFEDPLLKLFDPVNVTWLIFLLIYPAIISALIYFIDSPRLFHAAILTYAFLVAFRILGMYFLPLNPPQSMIMLNDPFVQLFGTGEVLTKDLFFSGHTSLMFMLFLITRNKVLKSIYLFATILVAICVLVQHVHYSIDVFAAPFFSFSAYKLTSVILIKND